MKLKIKTKEQLVADTMQLKFENEQLKQKNVLLKNDFDWEAMERKRLYSAHIEEVRKIEKNLDRTSDELRRLNWLLDKAMFSEDVSKVAR